jgi:hypothetical protein
MSQAAIHLERRLFLSEDGDVFPITNLYDAEGDETDDIGEAVAAVAGTEGRWFAFRLDDFETTPVN